jgi:hypothetical protein
LKILVSGLKLQQQRIDAILWLFDGRPLAEEEIRGIRRDFPMSTPECYAEAELRGIILDWLEELLEFSRDSQEAGPSEIIATGDVQANLAAVNALIELERQPGQRMIEMRYPSFVSLPPCAYLVGDFFEESVVRFRALNDLRLLQLRLYEERSIHPKACIEDYIESDLERGPGMLSKGDRRAQIQRWIELMESLEYPDYQVRFSEEPMGFELNLKTGPPIIEEAPGFWTTG